MTFRNVHRINGLFLLCFITAHMITHISGFWGIDTYNATQSIFRVVYRNIIIEPILLIAFVLQLYVGLRLSLKGFRRKMTQKWSRIQTISGLLILFFVSQHITGNLMARFLSGLDTTFHWPASVMNGAPFTLYFFPYYFIGVTAMFVHIACHVRLACMRGPRRAISTSVFWGISSFGAGLAIAINCMLLGAFFPIPLPPEWVAYLQGFLPNYVPN
jgi:succinate dehydrogenase/fumarate reductase cytochrome b subunit